MPELPEVETIVRGLSQEILNTKIDNIEVNYDKIIATHNRENFISIIKNQRIIKISRRAKCLRGSLKNRCNRD